MSNFKVKALFTALIFYYSLLIFLVADASLGYNTIPISKSLNKIAFAISPQGWGFFTRNPQEPLIDLYTIHNHQIENVSIPNASLKYFWGFNRGMRISSSQIAYFVDQIPKDKWIYDPKHNADSIIQVSTPFVVINDFSYSVHCGKFLLAKTERIPWAWSKHRENIRMPRSVVIIDETSIDINNFREVPTILLLNEETITSNQVSHHLANSTIDTDNQTLIYQTGSFSSMRAEEQIILRPGTHGAEFRAYIANSPCESLPNFRQAQYFSTIEVSNEHLNDLVTET